MTDKKTQTEIRKDGRPEKGDRTKDITGSF